MGNVIQIKRGSGLPEGGVLAPYELGYDTTNQYLYIGHSLSSRSPNKINAYKADRWTTTRHFQVDLESTSIVGINGGLETTEANPYTLGITGVLPITHGGTGTGSRITKNRLCWTDDPTNGTESDVTVIAGDSHYADASGIAINATGLPTGFNSGLYVNGELRVTSDEQIGLYADSDIIIEHGADSGIYIGGVSEFFIIEDGQCKASATACGYHLVDTNGSDYAGLYDNGDNLWIGAKQTQDTHHVGKTYISAGYDSTTEKGNPTIYISVPNASNNNASNYEVLHSGTKHILLKGSVGNATSASYSDDSAKITFANSSTTNPQKIALVYSDKDVYFNPASLTLCGDQDGVAFIAPYLKGNFITTSYGTADPSGTANVGQLYFQYVAT